MIGITREGALWGVGFDTYGRDKAGTLVHSFAGEFFQDGKSKLPVPYSVRGFADLGFASQEAMDAYKWSSKLGSGLGLGNTALAVFAGYADDGLLGATRAGFQDLLVSSIIYNTHEAPEIAKLTGSGAIKPPGSMGRMMVTGLRAWGGGAIGGYVGENIGEAIGSVVGMGSLGKSIGGMGGFHAGANAAAGLGWGGVATGLAVMAPMAMTAGAAYGTYSILKGGFAHARNKRAIMTAGDTSMFMTQGAFTSRERAVQAISKSHMNARSALGSEATYLSNQNRSYFSRTRAG